MTDEDTLTGRTADVWAEYQATARQLDATRAAATKVVADQSHQLNRARTELATLQTRLALQRARLRETVASAGDDLPVLVTGPRHQALSAQVPHQRSPQSPAEALTAITRARASLDTVDAMLTAIENSPESLSVARRNSYLYAGFAAAVALVQIPFVFAVFNNSFALALGLCGLITPVISFGLAWAAIGVLYERPNEPVDRTPILGAVISAAAAAPLIILIVLAVIVATLR